MKAIEFDSVTKKFSDGTVAVSELTFGIEAGETMVLIGPSGSGKTTTLRLLAGLDYPTAGTIWLNQSNVTQVEPSNRHVAMMFQSDALYQHMSVRGNLSFGLTGRKGFWRGRHEGSSKSRVEVEQRIKSVAQRLGIERLLDRKPHQLSGGERQRVALGRAMVREPAVFLLDEPLSRLDTRLAGELRSELKRVFRELGVPVLYVTHNQREAMALGDRIGVMDDGKIIQFGTPSEIYRCPANLFVANFVGQEPVNVLSLANQPTAERQTGIPASAALIGLRAEDLRVADSQGGVGGLSLRVMVREKEWLGDHTLVHLDACDFGNASLTARCEANSDLQIGDQVEAKIELEKVLFFDSAEKRIEPAS